MRTMSVDFLDLLPEHRTILEQALACYVADDRVAGVILYGSLAVGQGDEFSDIDLNILAVPEHRTELLTQAPDTMRTFGDTLFVFRADHLSPTQVVAHYANHVKLDLDFVLSEELGVYVSAATIGFSRIRPASLREFKSGRRRCPITTT